MPLPAGWQGLRTWTALAWCGGVLAYAAYSAVTYTGLYRVAAEWQQAQFGSYGPERTFLALVIGFCLPACLAAARRR